MIVFKLKYSYFISNIFKIQLLINTINDIGSSNDKLAIIESDAGAIRV